MVERYVYRGKTKQMVKEAEIKNTKSTFEYNYYTIYNL
jgi:hypothetical protein